LTVREASQMDKPLWPASYEAARDPAILGVSADMVAISPQKDRGPVEVLSIPGAGRKIATLTLQPVAGSPAVPVDAQFDGDSVYVTCSAQQIGRRKAYYGRSSSSRGLSIQKFSVRSERRLWARDLEAATMYFPRVLPLVVGKKHIVVLARHHQTAQPYYAYVLHAATGQEIQKLNFRPGAAAGANASRRRYLVGAPVMLDGRLCAEMSEGVTVYGTR
jgi:hypothetical protein